MESTNQTCATLIEELLVDPKGFYDSGRSYLLLQTFFDGASLEMLRPLLMSNILFVQRVAVFVASELGSSVCGLLDNIAPLLCSNERYLQYHAMEIITICSIGDKTGAFLSVVRMLETHDEVLRILAMNLMSRTTLTKIIAARNACTSDLPHAEAHQRGLGLLENLHLANAKIIEETIADEDPLVRRYGAIAAKRLEHIFSMVMKRMEASDDPDLRNFCGDST